MRSAALRFVLVWAAVALFWVVATGTFVPIDLGDGLEYLFIPRPWPAPVVAIALIGAGLAAIVLAVDLAARRQNRDLAEVHTLRWLTPAGVVSAVALGVLPAVPGVGERGAVLAYVF